MIPKQQPPQQKLTNISSGQPEKTKFNDKIMVTLGVDGENFSSLYFEDKNDSNFAVKTKDTFDQQRYKVKSRNGEKKNDVKKDRVLSSNQNNFSKA